MRNRIFAFSAGIVAVILSIILLIVYNPLNWLFDRVLGETETEPISDVEMDFAWYGEEELSDYEKITELTETYFSCFYSALGEKGFDGEDLLESLFMYSAVDSVYDLAAMRSCALRLENAACDLSAQSFHIRLTVTNFVKINADSVILMLSQSAECVYKQLSGISSGTGNYIHTFIFNRIAGNWLISSHSCAYGPWAYGKKAMNLLCGSEITYNKLYEKYPVFCTNAEEKAKSVSRLITAEGTTYAFDADTVYDRNSAAEYALRWTSINAVVRNSDNWQIYDEDSTNFTSQCIYAGVGRMDTKGSYIWKWFSDEINYKSEYEGRSMSWTEPENFYLYCIGNSGEGLVTRTEVAGSLVEKGDIVQLMFNENAVSQAIVTDVVKDIYGNAVDFLITSHDDDMVNYPLSLVSCDAVRFIKILGFNNS